MMSLSSSEIYDMLLLAENISLRSIPYWCDKFYDQTTGFHTLFKCIFCSKIIPKKVFDFNWRIFHGIVNNEQHLKAMDFSNGICFS